MAIFGYIVYLIMTGWVSLLALAVWVWPSDNKEARYERIAVAIIVALMYYGAYEWSPFSLIVENA